MYSSHGASTLHTWASMRLISNARSLALGSGFLYSGANTGTGGISFRRLYTRPGSSFTPCIVAAEMGTKVKPLPSTYLRKASICSSVARSHLLPMTICGRSASTGLNFASSSLIFSKSSMGSRHSLPETSTTCNSRRQRSTWRRKSCPRPMPSLAPSIRPGMSAQTKLAPSATDTTPSVGTSVVKW